MNQLNAREQVVGFLSQSDFVLWLESFLGDYLAAKNITADGGEQQVVSSDTDPGDLAKRLNDGLQF